jgi:hypothetical protein
MAATREVRKEAQRPGDSQNRGGRFDQRLLAREKLESTSQASAGTGGTASRRETVQGYCLRRTTGKLQSPPTEQYRTWPSSYQRRSLRDRKQLIAQAEQLAKADVARADGRSGSAEDEAARLGEKSVAESEFRTRIDRLHS